MIGTARISGFVAVRLLPAERFHARLYCKLLVALDACAMHGLCMRLAVASKVATEIVLRLPLAGTMLRPRSSDSDWGRWWSSCPCSRSILVFGAAASELAPLKSRSESINSLKTTAMSAMRPFSQFLSPRDEKDNFIGDEEDSVSSEERSFLMGQNLTKNQHKKSKIDTIRSILVLVLLTGGIVLVMITAVRQAFPSFSTVAVSTAKSTSVMNQPDILKSPCGDSPAEARARGCKFDNILFAWVHPRCYDEDLCKSFRDVKFHFSLDWNNTTPISQDEAYKGDYPSLFVNWEYHVTHCTWAWLKMHRSILGAGRSSLDGVSSDFQHTSHCETMLLRRQYVEYDAMNTVVSIKYPDCGA